MDVRGVPGDVGDAHLDLLPDGRRDHGRHSELTLAAPQGVGVAAILGAEGFILVRSCIGRIGEKFC